MKDKTLKIAPSLLSADFANMGKDIRQIEDASCEWIHLDVMDGHFVPPITFGSQMVEAIRSVTDLVLDVHLMVEKPESQIELFADAGADFISFHVESCIHSHRLIQQIKGFGKKCGISIVPSTPVSAISELLGLVDLILVMTVNPGYGGQSFIPECLGKIKELDNLRNKNNYNYLLSADGGVNRETAKFLRESGLDVAVCGSAFFSAKNKTEEVKIIKGIK